SANDSMGWMRLIVDAMTGEMISSVMRRDVQCHSSRRLHLFPVVYRLGSSWGQNQPERRRRGQQCRPNLDQFRQVW
ncbi:hypothetical protein PENTCL1PPCAC_27825, partial [Pristionchus entomophagus]